MINLSLGIALIIFAGVKSRWAIGFKRFGVWTPVSHGVNLSPSWKVRYGRDPG